MSGQFKKVLFGYDTADVDMRIKLSKVDFDKRYSDLEEKLSEITAENARLNEELNKLMNEQEVYDEYNDEIEKILRHAYEKASIEVYNTRVSLKDTLNEKETELESLQNKNQDINNSINKLLSKLDNITNRY